MAHWIERYADVESGTWRDYVHQWHGWSCVTDGRTLVMLADGGAAYKASDGLLMSSAAPAERFELYLRAIPQNPIECDLADLLRFAGYVQREACSVCFATKGELYCWTLQRPFHQQIGPCAYCYQTNGWIAPAAPSDDRKALVGGVMVCMSRLAWSIPPELVEKGKRVKIGRIESQGKGDAAGLLIDGGDDWRIVVAECYLTGPAITPSPTFYPDPTFAQLWQSARGDDPAAMAALADWLIDHEDAFAEVLQ